ncbi:winged helix-turn-helix transcriptional regulator [Acidicapsa acidisoli]|uniref:winged helix-turn-helix transcriptional regulator n=1 Tax=Acidicapsa acidisoli TaxID=1615681 RepID=UPI0021E0A53E|nr:winged helix-turn-helix transcriptional regulator [Acidicapsa acidisoli]
MAGPVYEFGEFRLDSGQFELLRNGQSTRVERKPLELLILLASRQGQLVTRSEIAKHLWDSEVFVDTEHGINTAIRKIRKVLGDDPDEPRFVQTVTGKGYRILCAVEVSNGQIGVHDPNLLDDRVPKLQPVESRRRSKRLLSAIVFATVLVIGLICAFLYLRRPLPPPRITEYNQITHDGRPKRLIAIDDSRLYFYFSPASDNFEVSVSGGEITQMPSEVRDYNVLGISPDGTTALLQGPDMSVWSDGVLGGSLRRINGVFATYAAYSADGKYVAYVTRDGDIYRVRSDGTEPQMLVSRRTVAPSGEWSPYALAWSPDGRVLRFSELNKIWEVSSTGSNLHRLFSGLAASNAHCFGHWTPDGRFFIYLSGIQRGSAIGTFYQISALDERRGPFRQASSEPIQLTSGPIRWYGAIPSRDGTRIFAVGVTPRGELVRFDSASRQLRPFLDGISAEFLSFSPDGKSLAYVTFPEGILWKANADGSGRIQLTDLPLYPTGPRWSPDGNQILFSASPDAQSTDLLYVVSSRGGEPHRLIPEDNGKQGDGSWSPDGRRIVFHSQSNGEAALRIFDLHSHRITEVPGSIGMYSPRWSPDGRFIAALSTRFSGLPVCDLETHRWSTVLSHEGIGFPSWSRDSRYLYILYADQQPGVYRVSVKGGVPERVVDLKGFHHTGLVGLWMGLDPNDAPLLLRDVGTDDLYALTLENK